MRIRKNSVSHRTTLLLMVGLAGSLFFGCSTTSKTSSHRPVKDAEIEQFTRAMRDFEGGRYHDAEDGFRNMIASYPGAPFLKEAQWYLVQSYIATGKTKRAHNELNLFLRNYRDSPYEKEARTLLLQIESSKEKVLAVVWSPDSSAPLHGHQLRQNFPGINTIILRIPDDQLRKTAVSTSGSLAEDRLYEWIHSVRKEAFRVLVMMPLRTMRWAVLHRPDWRDQRYDPERKILQRTETLDLFHPEVKAMLIRLCQNMAGYPIDGIYMEQIGYGMDEGGTPAAQALYSAFFLEELEWAQVLKTKSDRPVSVQFWRFAGLKSRYLANLLDEMRQAALKVRPAIAFGVGVPALLLMDPQEGLVQSSLDYLQLRESGFDFYVITSVDIPTEPLYASIKKYGFSEKVWFESDDHETARSFYQMPIQGVVVSSP